MKDGLAHKDAFERVRSEYLMEKRIGLPISGEEEIGGEKMDWW
jgi:hypothetical protein